MSYLLVQGCSKSKNTPETKTEAFDLYDGVFYRILKKARRENELRGDVELLILSAKYGLIEPEERIEDYNQRMTSEKAEKFRTESDLPRSLATRINQGGYDGVVVNLGEEYRQAIDGFEDRTETPVEYLSGGLGDRCSVLKDWIRSDLSNEMFS